MIGTLLHAFQIEQFKCFEQLRIPLAPLTVLSGYNGAGKSTALQPILLLAQAARRHAWTGNATTGDLPLNGEIIRLGSAGDVIRAQSPDTTARFELFGSDNTCALSATAKAADRSLRVTKLEGSDDWPELFNTLSRLVYLSAVRGGSRECFPTPDRANVQAPDVGTDGRFASYWYHELADTEIDPARRCPNEPATTFRKQIDAWLNRLASGASANVQALPVASMFALQFRLSGTSEWRRPANVGYGLTYAFPILVALLAAEPGDILVVDSPEAHLHPQAQSYIGRILAVFAAAGIQLIVETHSDHVLNGIRLAVRDTVLPVPELSLLFFVGSTLEGHGVINPRIDGDGRINEWPDGFSIKEIKTSHNSLDGVEVHWYLNDASLQGQFVNLAEFETVLRGLIQARARVPAIRQNLRLTHSLREAMVAPQTKVSRVVFALRDKDLKMATLSWLDKTGPFVDSDRLDEDDDYFEYRGFDVTETGLGEATRRTKAGTKCTTYSFVGGDIDYAVDPLLIDHGLPEERYGQYPVVNLWQTDSLIAQAFEAEEPIQSWAALVETARQRFLNIEFGELDTNPALAREPFEASLRNRILALMKILDDYVAGRLENGTEGPAAREIVRNYFTGERALFTGESPTNQNHFAQELTFNRISGDTYFAHWHGKISHRFFRMHFEWPLNKDRNKLEIFYLGPKITKH